jgi:putative hydrolase of the HAD superfamily
MVERFCEPMEAVLRRNAAVLRRLRRARRLGVVSNFYGNVDVLCREAGLAESLEVVVDSARVGVRKPDRAIFRIALEGLGAPAERVLFVGDSPERDLRPAQGLGMRTVWLKGPAARLPQDAVTPDAVIATLPELEALVA